MGGAGGTKRWTAWPMTGAETGMERVAWAPLGWTIWSPDWKGFSSGLEAVTRKRTAVWPSAVAPATVRTWRGGGGMTTSWVVATPVGLPLVSMVWTVMRADWASG